MRCTFLTAAALGGTTFPTIGRFVKAFIPHGTCGRNPLKHMNQATRKGLPPPTVVWGSRAAQTSTTTRTVAERIFRLVGREFDIGKPSVLAKVLFDDMKILHPNDSGGEALRADGKRKPRSVAAKSLLAALEAEQDPVKRELLRLVLEWLDAKAVARRGGFVALGAKVEDMPGWRSRLIPDGNDLRVDPSAPPVVIIDGHYLVYRSFYALPKLTTSEGTPVGALVGFCNIINKLVLQPWVSGEQPRRKVVVAFDSGTENFRHELSPAYKMNRPATPDDLRPQFDFIQKACEVYGLDTVKGAGFEADDVIASLALEAVTTGATDVTIVSADKDLAQLVTRRVSMLNVYTEERLGPDEVLAKYLAPPGRLADLLAIAGDKSDGIAGVEGYGSVKAAKVLAKHATLAEAVDEICAAMSKKKVDPALIDQTRSQVVLARRLVELCTFVPIGQRTGPLSLAEMPAFRFEGQDAARRLLNFMRQFEMEHLAQKTSLMLRMEN